jgi:hypothetical protein
MSKIELIHYRDPDSPCEIAVFLDGVRVPDSQLNQVSLDPGAGYSREEWEAMRMEDIATLSLSAAQLAWSWFKSASESKYIEDPA